MALIKCKECGKEYSDFLDDCPNCDRAKYVQSSLYINQQLVPGEYLIYKCKIHWQIWILPIICSLVFGPIILGVFLLGERGGVFLCAFILFIIWLSAYIRYTGTDLAITNKRVICKFGFIWRKSYEIHLDKIEGVILEQSVLGRIFDCASVVIRGVGTSSAPVPYILDFREFKQKLMMECESYRK